MNEKHIEKEIKEDVAKSLELISSEFKRGFDFIKKYPKSVSIFGSARFDENDKYVKSAENLAKKIVGELGYAVVTGGGPGIMEGANRGAKESGGNSLGINVFLPHEQGFNKYLTDQLFCHYFFTRKTILFLAAEGYVFFPGGFGTLDELTEILTLIQNKKIPRVPVFLFGMEFWEPLMKFINEKLYKETGAISLEDEKIYTLTDSEDQIVNTIKTSPTYRWWNGIEV